MVDEMPYERIIIEIYFICHFTYKTFIHMQVVLGESSADELSTATVTLYMTEGYISSIKFYVSCFIYLWWCIIKALLSVCYHLPDAFETRSQLFSFGRTVVCRRAISW